MTNHNIDHDESYGQRVQDGACGPTAEDLNASGDAFSRTLTGQDVSGYARADLTHENISVYPGKRPEDCTKEELEDPATLTLANGNLLPPRYMAELGPLDQVRADLEAENRVLQEQGTYPVSEMKFRFQVTPEAMERVKERFSKPLVSITATGRPQVLAEDGRDMNAPTHQPLTGEPLDPLPNLDVFVVYAKHGDRLAFAFYVDSHVQAETIVNTLNANLMGVLDTNPVYGWARVTNLADLMLEGM